MHLRIHIGLHKTGTTSFQEACFSAKDELLQDGILYPTSNEFAGGTFSHASFVDFLRSRGAGSAVALLERAVDEFSDCRTILLSSEEFSNLFGDRNWENTSAEFVKSADELFESVRYVCVIRDERSFLKSALREYFEGVGVPAYPLDEIRRQVAFHLGKAENLRAVLGKRLDVVQYEHLSRKYFTSLLLDLTVNTSVVLPRIESNVTKDKGYKTIIGGFVRGIYLNILEANSPYSPEVQAKYEHILGAMSLEPGVGEMLLADFEAWLDRAVERIIVDMKGPGFLTALKPNLIRTPPQWS